MTGRGRTFGDLAGMFRHLAAVKSWALGRAPGFTGLGSPLAVLTPGDGDVAQQLYHGQFTFAGRSAQVRPSEIFSATPLSADWLDELHGFAWLRHLEASGFTLHRAFARGLLRSWQAQRQTSSFAASCQRLLSLSRHAGFLMSGAGAEFETQFLQIVTREAERLRNRRGTGQPAQLQQAAALLAASLAFRGGAFLDAALARSAALAPQVILPDGGHMDRSPKSLAELLADLLPLRAAMLAQRIAIPHDLNAAIERGLPMLRMLVHGDGGLAIFQGVERSSPALVQAILKHDTVGGRPLAHAPHAGYARMAQGASAVIIDCGKPALCDSALAFEFSDGAHRIVGSCGMPAHASPEWRTAASSKAAHSTAEVIEHGKARKTVAQAESVTSPHGTLVRALAPSHQRDFFVATGGLDFRGEDRFDSATPFTIRFHLHPSIKASADRSGGSVMLLLPNKHGWRFSARGGALALEESIYLASSTGPRGSRQIVIRGQGSKVNWAFRKLDRRQRSGADADQAPQLPFGDAS